MIKIPKVSRERGSRGVMSISLTERRWPMRSRATSRGKTSSLTVMRELHRSAASRQTATGCMTWLGTSGNGPLTGTFPDTQTRWSNSVAVRRSILGSFRQRKATTQPNPSSAFLARSLRADRFFALPITVCVTAQRRASRR